MWSMAIQPAAVNRSLASSPLTFPTQNLVSKKPFSNLIVAKSKASILKSGKVMISGLKANQRSVPISPAYSTAVVAEALAGETTEDQSSFSTPPEKEKLGVVVKPMERPRLVLKFIWLEKNIGIGLDQIIPGHGSIPLSPYYFWPRKDSWEELKNMLESKPWISQKQMIILLNQATDIINLWQQNGGD